MKKLVVMLAVLAISNVAGAALAFDVHEITVAPSDYVTITVIATDQPANIGLFTMMNGDGEANVADAVNYVNQGAVADYSGATDDKYVFFFDTAKLPTGDPPVYPQMPGTAISLVFHCTGPGDFVIVLNDDGLNPLDTVIIHQIPEPMTLGLLGLGGLFLRRRLA